MDILKGKVIIATNENADQIENLRRESYRHSDSMKVNDEKEFEKYYKWSGKDDHGLVLLALTEDNQAMSSVRGNVYFTQEELYGNNINFANNSEDFVNYPVLDITIAATSPVYFGNDILSVIAYYMFFLHKHSVKSMNGSAPKDSAVYKMLENFEFRFREIANARKDFLPMNTWNIANLDYKKFDHAVNYLKNKYGDAIDRFPLIIT